MMPLAHSAGHTGGSWDKSWSKGIEQHVADASGPVAAGPVFLKTDKILVVKVGLFHTRYRKARRAYSLPTRSGPRGSSRSRMFMGCSVFRFTLPSGPRQWSGNHSLLW